MAWTGAATIKKIADNLYRITGLSLDAGAAGTISLTAGAGDVKVPAAWDEYHAAGPDGGAVTLAQSVQVTATDIDPASATTEPVVCVKTGTVPGDFLVTCTNRDAAATGALEIYARFH